MYTMYITVYLMNCNCFEANYCENGKFSIGKFFMRIYEGKLILEICFLGRYVPYSRRNNLLDWMKFSLIFLKLLIS